MHIKTSNQAKMSMGIGNYECNWGLHICGLYETDEERDDFIFGFLCQGLKDDDLQLYAPAERTKEDFKNQFSGLFKCAQNDALEDRDKIEIYNPKDLYYPSGTFSPKAMQKGLREFFKYSQRNGKRNVRATAEMVWALEAVPGVENLMVYEAQLNSFIEGKPWISLCMYNVNKFDGKTIMNVLKTHPYTLSKGIITQNPLYENPEDWLKENAPEFL